MLSLQLHCDESGTDGPEITVAGYLFEASRIEQFCEEWTGELGRFGLPYFHMVDCAHRAEPFHRLKKNDTIKVQMALMRILKKFAVAGVVCNTVNTRDNRGSDYSNAAMRAVEQAVLWATKTSYDGKIAYFFESGAKGQGLLDGRFQEVVACPAKEAYYRYAGHAFLPKKSNPGVQAADLLAWQYQNYTKKRLDEDVSRLDFRALLRHPHHIVDDCGDLPAESGVGYYRDVATSRNRQETIYYLPRATPEQIEVGTIISPGGKDTWMIAARHSGAVLACPTCWRALLIGWNPQQIRGVVLKCPCGENCYAPQTLPPFADGYTPSKGLF